jgi:hypothetical protein
MPRDLTGWASTLDLTALDDALALEVRQFVTRVPELREPYRAHLLDQLAAKAARSTYAGHIGRRPYS